MGNPEDSKLLCVDCKKEFVFSKQERQYFEKNHYIHVPKRCLDCRAIQRAKKLGQSLFPFNCQKCKKLSYVSFTPNPSKPLFCKSCLREISGYSKSEEFVQSAV